jgi:hypothetical protein
MTKEYLVDLLKKILNTDADPHFLPDSKPRELETLTARISHRIEQEKQQPPSSGGEPGALPDADYWDSGLRSGLAPGRRFPDLRERDAKVEEKHGGDFGKDS